MNPLLRHRDVCVVEILSWLDVMVKTCGGFTDTGRRWWWLGCRRDSPINRSKYSEHPADADAGRAELTLNSRGNVETSTGITRRKYIESFTMSMSSINTHHV